MQGEALVRRKQGDERIAEGVELGLKRVNIRDGSNFSRLSHKNLKQKIVTLFSRSSIYV